jgi:dTMP kinase
MSFFSFDGIDGVGKSTQIELLAEWLRSQGREVVTCRDPGSTPLGETLRRLLLDTQGPSICRRSEMLIYMAALAQMVEEIIRPALAAGKSVISDRFLLANVVYQAYAGGLDVQTVWQVGAVAVDNLHPDLTFLLDLDVATAATRRGREPDRMEAQGLAFLERVRQGFLCEARLKPERMVVIDASNSVAAIHDQVRQSIEKRRTHAARPNPADRG